MIAVSAPLAKNRIMWYDVVKKEMTFMPLKKHFVQLADKEVHALETMIKSGNHPSRAIMHANILLASNVGDNGKMKTQDMIAQQFRVSRQTVSTVRANYANYGLNAALYRKKYDKTNKEVKLDGKLEARIIAIACTTPPEGFVRWTLNLIAGKVVELGYTDSISHTLVATALK